VVAARIQGNYDELDRIARNFTQRGDEVRNLLRHVNDCQNRLESGDWTGVGAQTFFHEMDHLVTPALSRLIGVFEDARNATLRIVSVFHEAEDQAGLYFRGRDDAFIDYDPGDDNTHIGTVVAIGAIGNYRNGVNNWRVTPLLNMVKNQLLSQNGGTCSFYSIPNLLILSGMPITQHQADQWVTQILAQRIPPETPGTITSSLSSQEIIDFLNANGYRDMVQSSRINVSFDMAQNRAAAEQFLIARLAEGKPVRVATNTDNSFGVVGGHAYTVVGAQTDGFGNLTNVLVHTNWNDPQFVEIPANDFMTDWQGKGFRYMIPV